MKIKNRKKNARMKLMGKEPIFTKQWKVRNQRALELFLALTA